MAPFRDTAAQPAWREPFDARLTVLEPFLGSLPVLPDLVMRLVTLDLDQEQSYDEVVEIAEEDLVFATRVLALANSAALAPDAPVTSIPGAVARVGASRIAELVSSMALQDIFSPRGDAARRLWAHSVETAVLCRGIARQLVGVQVPTQEAYLLGLVHDLGRSVLLAAEVSAAGLFPGFSAEDLAADEVTATGVLSLERERGGLGFDHAEVGGLAAERIGLGPRLGELITSHHEPFVGCDPLLDLVHLAEGISVHAHLRPELFIEGTPEAAARQQLIERSLSPAWAAEPPLDLDALGESLSDLLTEAWNLTERLGG